MATIEIVASRFAEYAATPLLERTVDCTSSGAFVTGAGASGWNAAKLSEVAVTLSVNGEFKVRRTGGHPTVDPLLPALDLVNLVRGSDSLLAGLIITTGTYTGLTPVRSGDHVKALFAGFGEAEIRLA